MTWFAQTLASPFGRRALGALVAAATVLLFLINFRRAGERAGRLSEALETREGNDAIQRQMLEAANRRPHDRDALIGRLRDGSF